MSILTFFYLGKSRAENPTLGFSTHLVFHKL